MFRSLPKFLKKEILATHLVDEHLSLLLPIEMPNIKLKTIKMQKYLIILEKYVNLLDKIYNKKERRKS